MKLTLPAALAVAASALPMALAVDLQGSIAPAVMPLSPTEYASTSLELILPQSPETVIQTVPIRSNGKFEFTGLSDGTYLVSLRSIALFANEDYRIDVNGSDVSAFKVFFGHDYRTDTGPAVSVPIEITAFRSTYVIPREQFSLFAMLKSPMMLMSLAALGVVFVMPRITESLDVEALKRELEDKPSLSRPGQPAVQQAGQPAQAALGPNSGVSSSTGSKKAKKRR